MKEIDVLIKAMQWERCKGELRAMSAAQGSYSREDFTSDIAHAYQTAKWHELEEKVEAFIRDIEQGELHV